MCPTALAALHGSWITDSDVLGLALPLAFCEKEAMPSIGASGLFATVQLGLGRPALRADAVVADEDAIRVILVPVGRR